MKFLRRKIKVLLGWPAVSGYEYYWAHLWKNEGGSLEDQAEKLGVWAACKVAFHAIPDDLINKLYDSLPNRMTTVLQAKGTVKIFIFLTCRPWWNTKLWNNLKTIWKKNYNQSTYTQISKTFVQLETGLFIKQNKKNIITEPSRLDPKSVPVNCFQSVISITRATSRPLQTFGMESRMSTLHCQRW